MSVLVIKGDPGAIDRLVDELAERNYLGPEFQSEVVEVSGLTDYHRWTDFLYQLRYLVKHYITEEDSE